ncbi:MAG: hypothetical protein WCE75_00885 [Terracidiphilus sp.]
MASQRKPVIVRRLTRELSFGYAGARFGQQTPELEILGLDGKVLRIPWDEIKWVCYVRDLPANPAEAVNPERLLTRKFSIRPRTPGLWLRLTLSDGEELEGIAANDRSLVDGAGLMLTPPDTRSNTQRIYIPRQAIATLEAAALIGATAFKRPAPGPLREQPGLFSREPDAG